MRKYYRGFDGLFGYIKHRLNWENEDKFAGKWVRRVGTWGLGHGVGTGGWDIK
jgi:hypothetical protein